ncbi:hypothetical protein KUCAC02_029613, partial [Chaenocephalus aceratus]
TNTSAVWTSAVWTSTVWTSAVWTSTVWTSAAQHANEEIVPCSPGSYGKDGKGKSEPSTTEISQSFHVQPATPIEEE